MASLQGEALVLRVVEFGESDRIVHLLTPEWGRVTAMAKGARRSRKRFSGTLDLFHRVTVQIERRRPTSMARLDHTRLLDPHSGIREDPRRFGIAAYLAELVDRLATEGGRAGDAAPVYRAALAMFRTLPELPADARVWILLELRLLSVLGLQPELRHCVRCGREASGEARVRFHIAEGGPLCPRCGAEVATAMPVGLGTLRALEHSLSFPLDHLSRLGRIGLGGEALAEARALVQRFQQFHVGLELKSLRVLANLLSLEDAQRRSRAGGAGRNTGERLA